MDVRVTDLRDDRVVYERRVPVSFTDPLLETRFLFRVTELSFPHAGGYEISLAVGLDQVAAARFDVGRTGGVT